LTLPFGVKAVVIGYLVVVFICFFINAYYPGKLFGYGPIKQIKKMGRITCATLVMSLGIFGIMTVLSTDFLKLSVCIPSGILIYLISSYIIKIEEIDEVIIMMRSTIVKVKSIFN
jgi:hypothetical protein